MASGLYSVTTRAPGTVITSLIYNADHQAHIDGRAAPFVGGHSTALSQMQLTRSPFSSGTTEQLPASLGDEIELLRNQVASLKQYLSAGVAPAQWYTQLVSPGFLVVGARMVRTTNQSVSNNTATMLSFTGAVADFNTNSVWAGGTPTRFTAPFTGRYFLGAGVKWAAASAGIRRLRAQVNGSATLIDAHTNTEAGTSNVQYQTISMVWQLNATDYVEYEAFQTSGAALNVLAEDKQSVVGYMVFLGI